MFFHASLKYKIIELNKYQTILWFLLDSANGLVEVQKKELLEVELIGAKIIHVLNGW